jgi:hypothetical protein
VKTPRALSLDSAKKPFVQSSRGPAERRSRLKSVEIWPFMLSIVEAFPRVFQQNPTPCLTQDPELW